MQTITEQYAYSKYSVITKGDYPNKGDYPKRIGHIVAKRVWQAETQTKDLGYFETRKAAQQAIEAANII